MNFNLPRFTCMRKILVLINFNLPCNCVILVRRFKQGPVISIAEYMYTALKTPVFSGVRFTRSLVLYVCFVDRCLFFCTYLFFWTLCCLSFFHLRILITTLVTSNSSYCYFSTEKSDQSTVIVYRRIYDLWKFNKRTEIS